MNFFIKQYKICSGKNDLLCDNYVHKVKLDNNLMSCPKCGSELSDYAELNYKNVIITFLLILFTTLGFLYFTFFKDDKVKQNYENVITKIDEKNLVKTYVGTIEIDSLKYAAMTLYIKDIIRDDQGVVSFNFTLNTKDYSEKGIGRLYPEYNKIHFYSNNLKYNFDGDYTLEKDNKIKIIGENKKWQLKEQ
jgi:predicted DNA-binding ArsR family transcriptional regulator